MRQESISKIAFLGLAERCTCVNNYYSDIIKWNILGLKNIYPSLLFPLSLKGISLGFVVNSSSLESSYRMVIQNQDGKEAFSFTLNLNVGLEPPSPAEMVDTHNPVAKQSLKGWLPLFTKFEQDNLIIQDPGEYTIAYDSGNSLETIGALNFIPIDLPPLSEDEIAAIRSEPSAIKAVKMNLGCTNCTSKMKIYSGIELNSNLEKEGWIWYTEIPSTFVCECGKTTMDLSYIKKNLQASIKFQRLGKEDLNYEPLYEISAIEDLRNKFKYLLRTIQPEEVLQRFFQDNPIIFHQFPALKIISKPSILTNYFADFAILSPTKELLLVEIERANTRLMKKDGGIAAELSHAFDQVNSWIQSVDDQRSAFLESLEIGKEQVANIRGIVIAGQEHGYDARDLRRLKGIDRGRVSFLTYDDLLFSLETLVSRMKRL